MSRHKKNFSKSKTTPQSSPFGPKMAQNDPKKKQKIRNSENKNLTKWKLSVYVSKPKQFFFLDPTATPQNSTTGPRKAPNDNKKSYESIWVDPKDLSEPNPMPRIARKCTKSSKLPTKATEKSQKDRKNSYKIKFINL